MADSHALELKLLLVSEEAEEVLVDRIHARYVK